MTEAKPNIFKRIWKWITGTDIKERLNEPAVGDRGLGDMDAPSPDYALFERLSTQSRTQTNIRRVKTDILQGTKLVDEIIILMFNLQRPSGSFQQSTLLAALDRVPISTTLRAFYLYIDQKVDFPGAQDILDRVYERLIELSRKSTSLLGFLNERFRLQQQQAGKPVVDFSPQEESHRNLLINLFRCQFSVCRKQFPREGADYVFMVGRMPLHDIQEILRHRFRQRIRYSSGASNQDQHEVALAVTVKTAGRYEDKPLSFNAHRFGQIYDNSPQKEYNLFIGNWRTDWEFSIGAAEHDEIQHPAMGSESEQLKLNSLQITNNRWDYSPPQPHLPLWLKFYNKDVTRENRQDLRLCFVRPPILDNPLLNVLDRHQFRQEISFIGRVLPRLGGQLQQFQSVTDRSFREAVKNLTVVAAIEVRDFLWILHTTDNQAKRLFQNDQKKWELSQLDDRETFSFADTEFRWQAGGNNLYPEGFVGGLSIYPGSSESASYKNQLNVDKDAEGFLVSYDGHFPATMNPDVLLGKKGVVSIKCVEVSDDGRGEYALIPMQQPVPINPFFAFQPVYPREKGWPSDKIWLTYDKDSGGDLRRDEESGEALYNGSRVLAVEHSYHLIGGSSLFLLKVSGTPYIGAANVASPASRVSPPLALGTSLIGSAEQPPAEFSPTPLNIQIRLLNTDWGGDSIEEVERSNFAAHFLLTKKNAASHFLKAYFPHNIESAARESAFYERYRDRASPLFLCPPHMLRMNDDDPDEIPWGLVFPLLDRQDKHFPTNGQASMAQAAAVGLGMATLFEAMAKDGLINFDIDVTQLCFDANGRLVIVDFDNVFPALTDPRDQTQMEPLLSILREGRLPAKNSSLPPEAHTFTSTSNPEGRKQTLAGIGPAFSTYMLAIILLQILKVGEKSAGDDGLTLQLGSLLRRAAAEELALDEVQKFEGLLRQMLSHASSDRPQPSEVVMRFQSIVRAMANRSGKARADILSLLGDVF